MSGLPRDPENACALYVMRQGQVLNRHEQFTPILDFAHAFPAPYAQKRATELRAWVSVVHPKVLDEVYRHMMDLSVLADWPKSGRFQRQEHS